MNEAEITKDLTDIKVDIAEISKDIKYMQTEMARNNEGIKSINTIINTLNTMLTTFTNDISSLQTGQKRTGERLEKLESEPANKWKALTSQIISIVTTGLVGAVVGAMVMLLSNGGA